MVRYPILLMLFIVLLCSCPSALVAQTGSQLQLALIGNGTGPYYAPAGQTTQLKIEIFNLGPSDVFMVRGETYLDPNLNGNWQLTHSEDLGSFHVAKLESAIWTFELQMPSQIQAQNTTNGIPQVPLLMKIVYSNPDGKQQSASAEFLLSVPGAVNAHVDYSLYVIILGAMVLAVAVIILRGARRRSIGKAQS